MACQNIDTEETTSSEESDCNCSEVDRFRSYQSSVFKLRKKKGQGSTTEPGTPEELSALEKERDERLKALKAGKLMDVIASQKNKMNMWQSFPSGGDQYAVVFCYERDNLKAWLNLKAITFLNNYQLTMSEDSITLRSEEDKSCCKVSMQGVSHRGLRRTYKIPRAINYQLAVWHQEGDVLKICVPWTTPLA